MILVKKHKHQVFPLGQKDGQGHKSDDCQLQRIAGRDRKDIAHRDRLYADGWPRRPRRSAPRSVLFMIIPVSCQKETVNI